jgi:ribosomal protein S27AE
VTKYGTPQIYPDTTIIKATSYNQEQHEQRQQSGRGCPRCGGAVFEAEKVVEKGITYHKKCFTCAKCNRPQDDKLQVGGIRNT